MAFSLSDLFGGNNTSTSNVMTGERKQKTCKNCGAPGHNSRSCQEPKREDTFSLGFGDEKTQKKCSVCNEYGHNSRRHSDHVPTEKKSTATFGVLKLPAYQG